MNDFTFCSPTRFVFGKGVTSKVGDELAAAGYSRALVVYGGGSVVRTGTLDRVTASLDAARIAHVELGGVRPNPEVKLVREGIEAARNAQADLILAVGGGSVIDTAKAVSMGVNYDGDVWDFFAKKAKPTAEGKPDIACVLTIAAAGSEASASCVITNDELKLKSGAGSEFSRPKITFMDPELTYTLPAYQTACGATDMCAHILERFFSSAGSVPVTDEIALGLIRSIMAEAPRALEDPCCYDARASLMWAGMLAHNGIAGCGRNATPGRAGGWASHGLEHELSGHKPDVAHGAGLAVIMPAWMRYIWKSCPDRFLLLGEGLFGIEPVDPESDCVDMTADEAIEDAVMATIDELQAFFCDLGMPRTLGELGITAEMIPELLVTLEQNKGPVLGDVEHLTIEDCRKIYESAL